MSSTYLIKLKRNIHLACQESGDPSGYPILYFHGTPGSKKEIEYLNDAAAENNIRLIAFDRPGFGDSEFYAYTPKTLTQDIEQILKKLSIKEYSCLGYSAGAMYMADFYLMAKNKPESLFDIAGWVPVALDKKLYESLPIFDKIAVSKVRELPGITSVPEFMLKRAFDRYADDLELSQSLSRMSKLMGKSFVCGTEEFSAFFASNIRFAMHNKSQGTAYSLGQLFEDNHCKPEEIDTQYISWHGTEDDYVPFAFSEFKKEKIRNFSLHQLDGESHFQPFTHKQEIFSEINSIVNSKA